MKKTHLSAIAAALLLSVGLSSCSETSEDTSEFDNWQERNEAYFQQKYQETVAKGQQADAFVLTKWSLNDSIANKAEDHIVVEVLEHGDGIESPMYTDSVTVHFRGRTIPTSASPEGYIIGSSYEGTFYDATSLPRTLSMTSATTNDGLATALQRMHVGDRWKVYIPHQLGYGESAYTSSSTTEWLSASIPAYTTLVFDVKLAGFKRPDAQ